MPAPKKPTYGELSNIYTKLQAAEKVAKSRFPKDGVKVTHKMPDGRKLTIAQVEKELNKMNPKPKSIKDVAVPVKGLTKATPKATPKATAKPKAMSEDQKQAKAMDKLMAKRRAESKKTGSWPNYNTN